MSVMTLPETATGWSFENTLNLGRRQDIAVARSASRTSSSFVGVRSEPTSYRPITDLNFVALAFHFGRR